MTAAPTEPAELMLIMLALRVAILIFTQINEDTLWNNLRKAKASFDKENLALKARFSSLRNRQARLSR